MTSIKKKKGFTLIELLAVLIILAILALITVPIVLKTINNSKKSAAENSVRMYARAAEQGVLSWATDNGKTTFDVVNGWDDFQAKYGDYIEYSGNSIECLNASVNSSGNITLIACGVKEDNKDFEESDVYDFNNNKTSEAYGIAITTEVVSPLLLGDVDGNEEINIRDKDSIDKHLKGAVTFDENQLYIADINQDGKVDGKDSDYLQKSILGISGYEIKKVCPLNTDSYIYKMANDSCSKYTIIK